MKIANQFIKRLFSPRILRIKKQPRGNNERRYGKMSFFQKTKKISHPFFAEDALFLSISVPVSHFYLKELLLFQQIDPCDDAENGFMIVPVLRNEQRLDIFIFQFGFRIVYRCFPLDEGEIIFVFIQC